MKKFSLILMIFFTLISCSKKEEAFNKKPIIYKVKTKKVQFAKIPIKTTLNGIVFSKKLAFTSPKIDGFIEKFYIKEGDKVSKGQLLFTIKNNEIERKINSLKFQINALHNQINETKILIKIYKKSLAQAKANFDLAKKNYERFKKLIKTESVTKQEFDKIETEYINSKLELEKAKNFLKINKIKLQQLKNNISSLNEKLKELEIISNYRFVKAPFTGVVLKKFLDIGNLVSPGVKVLKIGSIKKVAYFNVPIKYKQFLPEFIIIQNKKYKIAEIIPDIAPGTDQFKIKVNLPDYFENGQFITATIYTGTKEGIIINKKYIRNFNGIFYTYICKNNYIIKTFLKGNFITDKDFLVISGLSDSDKLIIFPIKDFDENSRCE